MVTTHGITSAAGYYENTVQQKKDSTVKAKNNTASEQAVKSSEDKLSSKAKNYLDILKKLMEIMILLLQMPGMTEGRCLIRVIRNSLLFFQAQN